MKINEFLELLSIHKNTSLLFEYTPTRFAGTNYHITEVKHITVESVDCGAGTDAWKETVIQLWESPSEIGKPEYMSAYKALGILNKVGSMKSYDSSSEVKIEYGNASFHTAQLFISDYILKDNNLIFSLAVEKTDCKAKETCGIPETNTALETETTCAPGSGCC